MSTATAEIHSLVKHLEAWEQSLSERETSLAETVEAQVTDGVVQALLEASEHRGQQLERQRVLELIACLQHDFSTTTPYRILQILKEYVSSPADRSPDR